MAEICCINFRSIRIGSLRTYPPKDRRNVPLKFQKNELSFKVVLDPKELKSDAMKIVIPCDGITLVEGHLKSGCPVIWITTNSKTSEQIRVMADMLEFSTYPSPYFDPSSQVLADRRICIIPSNDPMKETEVANFYEIIDLIAEDKGIERKKLFHELDRKDANQQLIQCTDYILKLRKFSENFRKRLDFTPRNESEGNTSTEESQLSKLKSAQHEKAKEIKLENTNDANLNDLVNVDKRNNQVSAYDAGLSEDASDLSSREGCASPGKEKAEKVKSENTNNANLNGLVNFGKCNNQVSAYDARLSEDASDLLYQEGCASPGKEKAEEINTYDTNNANLKTKKRNKELRFGNHNNQISVSDSRLSVDELDSSHQKGCASPDLCDLFNDSLSDS